MRRGIRPRSEQMSPSTNRRNALRIRDTAALIREDVDEGSGDTLSAQSCFASSEAKFAYRLAFRTAAQLPQSADRHIDVASRCDQLARARASARGRLRFRGRRALCLGRGEKVGPPGLGVLK